MIVDVAFAACFLAIVLLMGRGGRRDDKRRRRRVFSHRSHAVRWDDSGE